MTGSVFKRCQCKATYSAKGKKLACKKDHGSWSYITDLGRDPETKKRKQEKHGRYRTKEEAQEALTTLLGDVAGGRVAFNGQMKIRKYMVQWLAQKAADGLSSSAQNSYRLHIERHINPHLGDLRLRDLRVPAIQEMLRSAVEKEGLGPGSIRRIHATLSSALGSAVRAGLIPFNVARGMDRPKEPKKKAQPWRPEELAAFLEVLERERLGSLYEVAAFTGARRGEAAGLRWTDITIVSDGATARGFLTINQQLVQLTHRNPCPTCGVIHKGRALSRPKTASGEARRIDLDKETLHVLIAHRGAQELERTEMGDHYIDHGLVWAKDDGTPLDPGVLSKTFSRISKAAGSRKVRLHDLRHGAASLHLAAGTTMGMLSKLMGHSSHSFTTDLYAHFTGGAAGWEAADRAAALVPRRSKPADSAPTAVTNR